MGRHCEQDQHKVSQTGFEVAENMFRSFAYIMSSLEYLSTREEACTRTEDRAARLLQGLLTPTTGAECAKEEANDVICMDCCLMDTGLGQKHKFLSMSLTKAKKFERLQKLCCRFQMPMSFTITDKFVAEPGCGHVFDSLSAQQLSTARQRNISIEI